MDTGIRLKHEYSKLETEIRAYRRAVFSATRNCFITREQAIDKMNLKFHGKLNNFNRDMLKATTDGWFTPIECSTMIYRLHKMTTIDFYNQLRLR